MKTTIASFIIFCGCFTLYGQQLKIIDRNTNDPIFDVRIENAQKTKSAYSNINGEIDLAQFNDQEMITFFHKDYNIRQLTVKRALKNSELYLLPKLTTENLNEVLISVSKFEQTKKEIPQAVVRLSQGDIAFSNPQTSADVLNQTGNVYIQKSQQGGGSPMIRGFSTNRLLISVDGVRMNNAIFRSGNIQNVISVDPLSIQNTEVVLGPGSIIYGSDAIGGVMSFQTKQPQLSATEQWSFSSDMFGRYATANDEKTVHGSLNFGHKKWGFLTNISYSDFGDLRMGAHGPDAYLRPEFVVTNAGTDSLIINRNPKVQRPTAYNQFNLMQKAVYQPDTDLTFDFGVFYTTTSNYSRYDRLIRYRGDNLRSAEWYYGPQQWFMTNVTATKTANTAKLYDKVIATVAYQNFKESRYDRDFGSPLLNEREEKVTTASFNLDFEKRLGSTSKLFYGLEYVYNYVNSFGSELDLNSGSSKNTISRYPNGSSWQSAASYLSFKYKPVSELVIQSGLRYNFVSTKADFTENNRYLNLPFTSTKIDSDALTGNIGAHWIPNKHLQWRLNFSTAFRAPNIDDIGKVFDSEPGAVVVPNNSLEFEYAYSGELGLVLKAGAFLTIDLATYYTYLEDALVRRDFSLNGRTQLVYDGELSSIQAIQNASEARVYGFEVGIKVNLHENILLTSQYNVIGGEEVLDAETTPARHAAPNFGNTHLIITCNNLKFDAFVDYNSELSNTQLAPSEQSKDYIYAQDINGLPFSPSWYTLNFRSQYSLNNSVTITAALENITDQRYKTYSSGIASAGRNFIVSLKYSL